MQQRVAKIEGKKPILKCLVNSFPLQSFRPLLDKGYMVVGKSDALRKQFDPLNLFKMLVL